MKQNGLGWKKDLGLARLLRNHYNVNYNINLRMLLKRKNKTISLLDSKPWAEQKKFCLPKNNTSSSCMFRPCLISALLIPWPINHVETKLSDGSALVCCPHKCIPRWLTSCQPVNTWVVLSVRASEEDSMLGQTSRVYCRVRGSLRNSRISCSLEKTFFWIYFTTPRQDAISPPHSIAQEIHVTRAGCSSWQ